MTHLLIRVFLIVPFLLVDAASGDDPAVEVLVGNRLPGEGGPAEPMASPLTSPFGVDFDSHDNMIVVELEGGRVHRFSPNGELQQIAGDGSQTYSGDGGPAAKATFNAMHNVAITKSDDIYLADSWNHCVRKIDAKTGVITTFSGNGKAGFGGDGGTATAAVFDHVMCITFDPQEQHLYIADLGNRRIRAIDMDTKIVRTVAGNGEKGVPDDGSHAVDAPLVDPRAVTADADGNIYILERGGHALRLVTPDGRIHTVAGTGEQGYRDGPAREAMFGAPKHLCLGEEGTIYIADDQNNAIRKYDSKSDVVSTVLGKGTAEDAIRLKNPHGVAFHRNHLYVVDMGHDRVLRVD